MDRDDIPEEARKMIMEQFKENSKITRDIRTYRMPSQFFPKRRIIL